MPLILDDHLPQINTLHMSTSTSTSTNRPIPHPIRIRNRRKRYLESHPQYFSPDLESASPLLYDRLIRRFFTPADREIERRQKGYAGSLEADLLRSEAKLDEAQHPDADTTYTRTETGEIVANVGDEEELSKEEAYERWYAVMERRFLDGEDTDFDYGSVDGSEEYDDRRAEERDAEEEYFDAEEPDARPREGEREVKAGLQGETGVQDF